MKVGQYRRLARNRYQHRQGYIEIRPVRGGPKVLEHRYVMEQHLGRKLVKGEVVHHINGDPSDNRIENLELCTSQSAHFKRHIVNGDKMGCPCINDWFSLLPCNKGLQSWFRRNPTHPKTLQVMDGTYRWRTARLRAAFAVVPPWPDPPALIYEI